MQSSSKSANQTPPIFPRLWEIDALRGIAIIQMVFYHFMWDLNYFGLFKANMLQGPWQIFARGIATQFLLILGLSLTISYHRTRQKAEQPRLFGKYLRRSAQVFGLGMVITVATYFFIGAGYVRYGILHLLGSSVILAYPFLGRNRWLSLWAGAAAIIAGWGLKSVVVSWPWLIWLGVRQTGIYMVDYYPLLPWGGAGAGRSIRRLHPLSAGTAYFFPAKLGTNQAGAHVTFFGPPFSINLSTSPACFDGTVDRAGLWPDLVI